MKETFMRRISLLALLLAFLLVGGLGCGDSEPKKVEENPFKARQEAQKEKNQGKMMMPKGFKPKEAPKDNQ
jgi:hypothetical protein